MILVAGALLLGLVPPAASAATPRSVRAKLARAAAPPYELKQTSVRRSFGTSFYRFEQRVGGVPVLGADTVVADAPGTSGDLFVDGSRAGVARPAPPSVRAERAIAVARARTGATTLRAAPHAALAILPNRTGGRLVWRTTLPAGAPFADYEVLVDARSAAVVRVRDRLRDANGKAKIFDPNPVQTQGSFTGLHDDNDADSARLTSLRLAVTLPRLDGSGCLRGRWAHAVLPTIPTIDGMDYGPSGEDNPAPPMEVCQTGSDFSSFTRHDDEFEAAMGYFHIDRAQSYIHSLGFSHARHNGIVDRRITVRADYESDDNSHYSPATKDLTLGIGGVDDGEDAGVFVHEYGHAIQGEQSPNFNSGDFQAGSIGEGFSDWFAQMVLTHFRPNRNWIACWSPWDNTEINKSVRCERRIDETRTPNQLRAKGPHDRTSTASECRDDIHCEGEAWSGALFVVSRHIGQSKAVRLVLQSQFAYTGSTRFNGASRALLAADRQLYHGNHQGFLKRLLCSRQLLRQGCATKRAARRHHGPRFTA